MEHDRENRFGYLLQPIRDLTKNWDIDVASHLEDYLSEIEKMTISFDSGVTTMNFTEAALLIQGFTCVYSKKVEYLYTLVYQTLNLIASKQKSLQTSVDEDGKDKDVSFANREEEQFLTLDDIKEGRNIDLDEAASRHKAVGAVPRTPMSLVPFQESEKSDNLLYSAKGEVLGSKMDYKMNTGTMHSSGALLLEPMEHIMRSTSLNKKLLLSPPSASDRQEVQGHPLTHQTVASGSPQLMDSGMFQDPVTSRGGWSDDEGGVADYGGEMSPLLTAPRKVHTRSVAETVVDPWTPLDPHQVKKQDERPFRKGNTFRTPKVSSKSKKRKSVDQPAPPNQPLVDFIIDSFYSHSSLYPKQHWKAPSYPESESQYWKETRVRKRRQKTVTSKLKQARKEAVLIQAPTVEEDDEDNGYSLNYVQDDVGGDDSLHHQVDTALGRVSEGQMVEDYGGTSPPHAAGVDPSGFNVSGDTTAKHSGLVQSYEELVRDYVEQTLVQAHTYAQETDLSKRVQEWDDRIRPQLQEEDSHPPFDIHTYGSQIVEDLDQSMQQTESEWIPFGDLVRGKNRYDVCRTFSAMLQLANNYNIKIDAAGGGDEGEDTLSLQLISKKLVFEDILEFRAPSVFIPDNDDYLDD